MSINTLPYNPTILSEIAVSPAPPTSSLSAFALAQATAQNNFQITIGSVGISATSGKEYLVQVSFSATANANADLSLVLGDGISAPTSINITCNNYNKIYTTTFKYTATSTGSITLGITANVSAPQTLITTTVDFVNIVVFTL
jgi:hypothetical protein